MIVKKALRVATILVIARLVAYAEQTLSPPDNRGLLNSFATAIKGPETFTCGAERAMREEVQKLVMVGPRVLPEIEGALAEVESMGIRSKFGPKIGWLCYVYAKLNGPRALPRLQELRTKPSYAFVSAGIDDSIALSLGLTSYLDSDRPLAERMDCSKPIDPRNALDGIILGWQKQDRAWIEKQLGPNALASLAASLKKTSWAEWSSKRWRGTGGARIIGYRFLDEGDWNLPSETLSSQEPQIDVMVAKRVSSLATRFVDHSGNTCGAMTIVIRSTGDYFRPSKIDNPNIVQVLSLIASCSLRARLR